jgi:NhaP-type Na+/H+ or K+/H+ antiporter
VVQLGGLGLASFGWRERLLVAWVAPRGIVTAAVASLFALQLDQAGVAGGGALKGLVFLTILLSVSLQGFTAPALAQRLGLASEAAGDALPGLTTGLEQQPGGEQVGSLEAAE